MKAVVWSRTLPNSVNRVNRVVFGLALLTRGTIRGMGELDPDDRRPPFQQVADALRSEIQSGALAPGAQLPALTALGERYGVAVGTVKSALALLRDEGLIVTRHGKGSFVRTRQGDGDADDRPEYEQLRDALGALTQRVDAIERKLAD